MTATNQMSISRALTWLKHFIPTWSTITAGRWAEVIVNGRSIETSMTAEDFQAQLKTQHQSIMDRVNDVYKKREAINAANQKTQIRIGDKDFTVANAMIYRQHVIPLLERYVADATTSIDRARRMYNEQNNKFQAAVNNQIDLTDAGLASMRMMFEPTIIDNRKEIEELKAHINAFKLDFDALLSEQNSITTIDL